MYTHQWVKNYIDDFSISNLFTNLIKLHAFSLNNILFPLQFYTSDDYKFQINSLNKKTYHILLKISKF